MKEQTHAQRGHLPRSKQPTNEFVFAINLVLHSLWFSGLNILQYSIADERCQAVVDIFYKKALGESLRHGRGGGAE